jgi:hypothetical protein
MLDYPVRKSYLVKTIRELPARYSHLSHDPYLKVNGTLLDVIKFPPIPAGENFITVDSSGEPVGFVGYILTDDFKCVSNIKTFDFNFEGVEDFKSDVTFKDVLGLVGELRRKYACVRFFAYEDNVWPFEVYKKYTSHSGGIGPVAFHDSFVFIIPGTCKLSDPRCARAFSELKNLHPR